MKIIQTKNQLYGSSPSPNIKSSREIMNNVYKFVNKRVCVREFLACDGVWDVIRLSYHQ